MTHHAQQLVDLYRKFYRAKGQEPSSRECIQPLWNASEMIVKADIALRNPEALTDLVAGSVYKLMCDIRSSSAPGRVVTWESAERSAIFEFSQCFVKELFYGAFGGDIARYDGQQREILEDTCEFLYRVAQDQENKIEA